jgi:integrase/recombinase XerD
VVLLRVGPEGPEGPLAAYLRPFAQTLGQKGYTRHYLLRHIMLTACFSKWLKQAGVLRHDITSRHPARYLRCRYRERRPRLDDPAVLGNFIEFLRREKAIPAEKVPARQVTPVERCVHAYEQYLRDERVLAQATIINYVPFIQRFLKRYFGTRRAKLSSLRAKHVVRFVRHQAPRLHLVRAKLMATALRSFFQYARSRGEVALDLAAAVPIVASWSMTSIPRAIAPDQVRQLLTSIDRRTAVGRRDYAIILLLARLGLRSGEVVSLELDDIDWSGGKLTVRGKGGRHSEMPLPADAGRAIAAYLRHGRPHSSSRRVFLRARAPISGFHGASGLSSIVRHRLEHAGITAPTYGTHQFRHGLATEMLRQGASLAEIGGVLGHKHPDTTRIYAKVNLQALRTLALPWPRGAR